MVLKKPSDYFKKEQVTLDNSIQELSNLSEVNTFSDAFESFKNNLNKIELLSEFSETLDSYRLNVERVNFISEKVEDIQSDIKSLLKKEDLDRAMMSQLFVVEQTIKNIQNNVRGINEKNLTEIRLDVSSLTNNVTEFLDNEVPRYKKLIVDSELRSSNRYEELEENVNKTLEGIGEFVENKYDELTKTLTGINENSLSGIFEEFKILENVISNFKEEEIPKYKGFIVETERKVEFKLDEFDNDVTERLGILDNHITERFDIIEKKNNENNDEYKNSLAILENTILELKNDEIPKYKGFIVETERKVELKLDEFDKNITERFNIVDSDITERFDIIEKKNSESNTEYKNSLSTLENTILEIKNKELPKYKKNSIKTEQKIEKRIDEFQNQLDESIFNILEKVNLIEGDKSNLVEIVNDKIKSIKSLGERVVKQLGINEDYRKHLTKKVAELEIQIIRNESHLKVQNRTLEQVQENIRSSIEKLNFGELEEKNYELSKKVKYLEEIFEKFNENKILNENEVLIETTLAEPPSTKNKDALTPLDQKFVTLDQLQSHYKLFINRIQQQMATIGGGGETRLKYLDDIVGIATNPSVYNNKFLKYDHSIQKFVFSDVNASSLTLKLTELDDVDSSNLSGISTDYLMVYDTGISGFKFVDPKIHFGINSDFNPNPQIDDFGGY